MKYEATCGECISHTIAVCIELAAQHAEPITFTHNEVTITVEADSDPEHVLSFWREQLDANSETYRRSPEGRKQEEEYRRQCEREQREVTALEKSFPEVLAAGEDALVEWLGKLAAVGDRETLIYDRQGIATALEMAGYVANAFVNDPRVKTDREAFAGWVIGQAIDNLRHVGAIHPVMSHFAEMYRKQFGEEATI